MGSKTQPMSESLSTKSYGNRFWASSRQMWEKAPNCFLAVLFNNKGEAWMSPQTPLAREEIFRSNFEHHGI